MKGKIAKKVPMENGVMFNFADGTKRGFDLDDLPEEVVRRAAIHGISQKLGDGYSGITSVKEAIQVVDAIWEQLQTGDWNAKVSRTGKYVEAIARVFNIDTAEAQAKYDAIKDDDDRMKAMKKHPSIVAAIAQIDLENAQKVLDKADTQDAKPLEL